MYTPVLILHKIDNIINITSLVTIHYFEFNKDYVFAGEVHDVWEMVYVDKGDITATADTDIVELHQGDVIFHKPGEFHSLQANGRIAPNVFVMTFTTRSKMMRFFEKKHFHLQPKYRRLIASVIEEGRKAFQIPFFNATMNELIDRPDAPAGAQQLIRLYLEQLLIFIFRDQTSDGIQYKFLPTKDDVDDHITAEIIAVMEENLCGNLKVEDICRQLNYGKTYLSNTFRQKTGYSIKEYYNVLKIAEGKKLIREKNHSISEIAAHLGFDTPQYFSRVFSKITGMTPTEYVNSVI